jgi:hypothetical protein
VKLEDQVCSLELAKRLKDLGVKQESLHEWTFDQHIWELDGPRPSDIFPEAFCSAFTVAELGEMLPILVRGKVVKFHKLGADPTWIVEYLPVTNDDEKYHTEALSEADARAKMLIYLLENKLLKENT